MSFARHCISTMLDMVPCLRGPLKSLYWWFSGVVARILGTEAAVKRWESVWDARWIAELEEGGRSQHRDLLFESIARLAPFESVIEIGCNCGVNLYRLAMQYPRVRLVGCDVNHVAIERGRAFMQSHGLSGVELSVGRADRLGSFANGSFDVVFTDAVLIYIGPDQIRKVAKEMLRLCRRRIILMEWHREGPEGVSDGEFWQGFWVWDYARLFRDVSPGCDVQCTKLPGDMWSPSLGWARFGYLIEVAIDISKAELS